MQPHFRIAAIGELLWDLLPDGPQLGGAPANFAAMSASLAMAVSSNPEDEIFLISRVGDDPLGRHAFEQLATHGVALDHISIDSAHATGTVTVSLAAATGPTYRIEEDAAWDYISETPHLTALAPTLDAICFGTLAQRSPVTRKTLRRLVDSTRSNCVRIFDVNLRAPYWMAEALSWGCAHATILKMNDEEVPHLARALDAPAQEKTPLQIAHFLLGRFPIKLVAITRGAKGSLLVTREAMYDHPGVAAKVVDAIGAGDAFTAALTYSVLRKISLPCMAEAANRWGAWVAAQRGGMPPMDESTRREWEHSSKQQ
jgi:fructokinase